MTEVTPDWKPAARVKDPSAGTAKIRHEGRCRACGLVGLPYAEGGPINRAHIVAKSQRGDDVDANFLPLCGSGTTGCHAAFDNASPKATYPSMLAGATREFVCRRIALSAEELEYALEKKGREWTNRRFCKRPALTTP